MDEHASTASTIRRVKPELLVALVAVLISFVTLFVYVYQSSLMATQQKMSVWPHLTFGPSWGQQYLQLNLINKGVGPAIIKEVEVRFGQKQLQGIHEVMAQLPDTLQSEYSYSSLWPGQVLMAGETIRLFELDDPATITYLLGLIQEKQIEIVICYCSIYEDCWRSSGIHVQPSACN